MMKCSCGAFIAYCPCCGKSLIAAPQHHTISNPSKEDGDNYLHCNNSCFPQVTVHKETSIANNDTTSHEQRSEVNKLPCRPVSAFELFCIRYAHDPDAENNSSCNKNTNINMNYLPDECRRRMAECWLKADSATRHKCEMEATQWSQIWKSEEEEINTDAGLTSDYHATTINKNNIIGSSKTDMEEHLESAANVQAAHTESVLTRPDSELLSATENLTKSSENVNTRDVCNFMLKTKRNRDKRRRNNIDYLTSTKKELDKKRAKETSLSSLQVINSFSVFCRIMKGRKLQSGERSQIWHRMTPAEKAPFDEVAARLRTEKYLSNLK